MIKPYYQDDLVTIYHGDCREILPTLPTAGDVLVTDPPYGMNYSSNRSLDGPTDEIAGDADPKLRDEILQLWHGPALVFGTWRIARPANVRHVLTWDKGANPGTGDLSMPWGNSTEEIYVIGTGWTGKRGTNVIRVDTIPVNDPIRKTHPTPKPVDLLRQLILRCPPLAGVVDPFMGSGTTLRAAKDLGRSAIGIEVEERYCEVAARRLAQEVLDLGA